MSQLHQIDFSAAFQETMDQLGLSSKQLAESSGRSRNNISEIRKGKVNTGIQDFAELLSLCESLKPGFIATFARKLTPSQSLHPINWAATIDRVSEQDAVLILGAISAKFSRLLNNGQLTSSDNQPKSA